MAINTWDGAANVNWDDDGNWNTTDATDRIPTDADDVIIPDTSGITYNPTLRQNQDVKSLTIATDGTVVGGGHTIIIHDEGDPSGGTNQYAAYIQGIISGELNLDQRTEETGYLRLTPSSGNIHNLTINHADCNSTLGYACTITGDLTITAGEFITNNVNFTANGTATVSGTMTCGSSDITLGSGVTSGYGLSVAASGTFTGGSGTHIMGSLRGVGGSPGATITLSSGVTTINSEYQSSNQVIEISGGSNSWNNGSGTLIITTPAASNFVLNKSGATLNNFTINHADAVITIVTTAITVAGNLIITAGEFNTGGDHSLTVTGYTTINGGSAGNEVSRLNLNGSTAILGSGITSAPGILVQNGGGFYADADSTVTMGSLDANYDGSNEVRLLGTNVINSYSDSNRILKITSGVIDTTGTNITITTATTGKTVSCFDDQFGNLTLTPASSTTYNMVSNGIVIGGNLTINANATLDTTGSNYPLTVTGATSNYGTLTLNGSAFSTGNFRNYSSGVVPASTGTHTFTDALRNDNSYTFTSGNTLLTGRGVGNGGYLLDDQGSTMNYNGGTINIGNGTDIGANTNIRPQTAHDINDLIINCTNSRIVYLATACDIAGDLTITAGAFNTHASNYALTVTKACDVTGTLTLNGSTVALGALRANSGAVISLDADGTLDLTRGTPSNDAGWGDDYSFKNDDGTSDINIAGTLTVSDGNYFSPRTAPNYASVINNIVFNGGGYWVDKMTFGGTLEVTAGSVIQTYGGSNDIFVTGDATINGNFKPHTGYVGLSTGNVTVGSLTINSGGGYYATSGTTTINGGFHNNGNYFPNGGTIEMGGTGSVVNALPPKLTINNDAVPNFDGDNDYINISGFNLNDELDGEDITIAMWINPDAGTFGDDEGNMGFISGYVASGPTFDGRWGMWIVDSNAGYGGTENHIQFRNHGNNATLDSTTALVGGNWYHVAITYVDGGAGASGTAKIYINGVLEDTTASFHSLATDVAIAPAQSGGGSNISFDGKMADIRIYDSDLGATNIAKLSSKMNVDVGSPLGWWKLDEGTGTTVTNSGSVGSSDGTLTNGPTWLNNAFTTTLLPTMTEVDALEVKSGVLDLDSRNYPHLDGSADYITTGTALQAELRTSHSISAWIKMDDGVNGNDGILGTRNAANEDASACYIGSGGKLSYYYSSDGAVKYAVENSASFVDGANPWKHVVATMSYTDASNAVMKVFVDGLERALDGTNNGAYEGDMGDYTSSDEVWIGVEDNNNVARWFFDGGMRDVQFYDYALSVEQVKSLYLGNYPPTPKHWWKMNEGTGATATIEDYGHGTDSDGTGVSLTWAGTDNFKVNGSARIGTNGSI